MITRGEKIESSVINNTARQMHPYHLVDASPWPLIMSIMVLGGAVSMVSFLTHMEISLIAPLVAITFIAILWWRDVIREAKGGYHTTVVQKGILIGFLLFLLSEVMLFGSFFWAFFHASLAPAVEIGSTWPPEGITPVNPWSIPLLGTCVLLASSFILTISHHAAIAGQKDLSILTLFITVVLGFLFVFLQYNEYKYGEFTLADSVFGTVFYSTTFLHMCHVIIGALFLAVALVRLINDSFTSEHHLGFEFSIFYYHLVDVIWILVFFIYYWWGS